MILRPLLFDHFAIFFSKDRRRRPGDDVIRPESASRTAAISSRETAAAVLLEDLLDRLAGRFTTSSSVSTNDADRIGQSLADRRFPATR